MVSIIKSLKGMDAGGQEGRRKALEGGDTYRLMADLHCCLAETTLMAENEEELKSVLMRKQKSWLETQHSKN